MATLFFATIFGQKIAPRVMDGITALCIFGNIIVMTFTASRVKQEIAKEGILPWSLFFATGRITPDAWLRKRFSKQTTQIESNRKSNRNRRESDDAERTPMAALLLHWSMSVILIGITAFLSAATAYFVLVFLYSYVLVALVGFLVSSGLVYLYFSSSVSWHKDVPGGFRPWGGPTAAIIYSVVSLFLLVASFLKPADGSPFAYSTTNIQWYILPSIGISSLLWGVIWWLGMQLDMRARKLTLVVKRIPYIEPVAEEDDSGYGDDDGEWVVRSEYIKHEKKSRAFVETNEWDGSSEVAEEDAGRGGLVEPPRWI